MPNLEHAILQTGKLAFHDPEKVQILFVGLSEINQKILKFFKDKNFQKISLCNRSDENGHAFSTFHGIQHLAWSQLNEWHQYDWIIFGTKSPDYLIKHRDITKRQLNHKLIIDLCVPRNVEPKLGQDQRITLLNIDQINRLLKTRHHCMAHALAEAERRISQATSYHAEQYIAKGQSRIDLLAVTA